MSKLLTCDAISKSFKDGKSNIQVLNNVSFSIEHGEQVAILGSSGSGKSTLLHLLGALDTPSSGSVIIDGQKLFSLSSKKQAAFRNQYLGFVYQFHHLLPEFTAEENVAMPALIAGERPSVATSKARELLDRVMLTHRYKHKPSELSGGERQRVAIARALINQPKLVLADEPTGNLDSATGETIAQLLASFRSTLNTAFVVVTHDNQLAQQFDRILTLKDGQLRSEAE